MFGVLLGVVEAFPCAVVHQEAQYSVGLLLVEAVPFAGELLLDRFGRGRDERRVPKAAGGALRPHVGDHQEVAHVLQLRPQANADIQAMEVVCNEIWEVFLRELAELKDLVRYEADQNLVSERDRERLTRLQARLVSGSASFAWRTPPR